MAVDPRTPVIVGVGQFTERIDDPGYRGHVGRRPGDRRRPGRAGRHRRRPRRRGARPSTRLRAAAVRDLHPDAGAAGQLGQLPTFGAQPRSVPIPRGRCSSRSAARSAEAGHRVRRRHRRRRRRRGDDHRLRARVDGEVLRRPGRQTRFHRARRRSARRPRARHLQLHRRVHRPARPDRRARAVRPARQRPSRPAGSRCRASTATAWPSCSRRCRKWLPRTRSRRLRSSVRSTRSTPSPTRTG